MFLGSILISLYLSNSKLSKGARLGFFWLGVVCFFGYIGSAAYLIANGLSPWTALGLAGLNIFFSWNSARQVR